MTKGLEIISFIYDDYLSDQVGCPSELTDWKKERERERKKVNSHFHKLSFGKHSKKKKKKK